MHEATLLAALQAMGHQPPPPVAPQALAAWAAAAAATNLTSRVTKTEGAEAAKRQLEIASKGVCHCEAVFAAKALALLHLGRLLEAAAACDEPVSHDEQRPPPAPSCAAAHWRLWVRAQCAFHLGKYSQALQQLDGLRAALKKAAADATAAASAHFSGSGAAAPLHNPTAASGANSLLEAVVVLPSECELEQAAVRLNEAQRLRQAGNELIREGRYADAVRLYTAALEGERLVLALLALCIC